MRLMEEVYYQYFVSSIGFDTQKEVLDEINLNHQGYECVPFYSAEEKKWYVLHRVTGEHGRI